MCSRPSAGRMKWLKLWTLLRSSAGRPAHLLSLIKRRTNTFSLAVVAQLQDSGRPLPPPHGPSLGFQAPSSSVPWGAVLPCVPAFSTSLLCPLAFPGYRSTAGLPPPETRSFQGFLRFLGIPRYAKFENQHSTASHPLRSCSVLHLVPYLIPIAPF